jgi:hypothetical protein
MRTTWPTDIMEMAKGMHTQLAASGAVRAHV